MKSPRAVVCLVLALTLATAAAVAQDATPSSQLKELVQQISKKLQAGPVTEEALADDLKQFDALLKQYEGQKTDEVARILFMKAMLYQQVLDQPQKAIEHLELLVRDFPETEAGREAGNLIARLRIQENLVVGKTFPDFNEKDLEGKPLSVGRYQGKVVLVDFWATWCGPCVAELPNVLAAYDKYHAQGFEILGISLDQNRDKLTTFIKDKKMTWAQYFDGEGWKTKLATQYGIDSIPATFLLDRKGVIIAKNLRGEALDKAVAEALGQ